MAKSRRIQLLTQLLCTRGFSSQEEIARALKRSGEAVTQATLSRDLRSLGAVRRPDRGGRAVYELPQPGAEVLDRDRQALDLRVFVNDVRQAGNLLVVLTPPGHAHAVGRALDLLDFPGWVGSVAGDDTVLGVLETAAAARRLERHLEALREGKNGGGAK
jgi:transcriptional regulator of arginine metabolism